MERAELTRLAALPRFTRGDTRLLGPTITLPDSASFVWTYRDIFQRELYAFRARSERPYIIDGGANIGLSVLYFKRLYPLAEIVAFEPDPYIFGLLEQNLRSHGHDDVRLERRALWSSETRLSFHGDGADGGRVGREEAGGTAVQAVRLPPYLDRHVDLLKLDIEGAETEVLGDCREALDKVERLYLEYHSTVGQPQTLHVVLEILASAGFRVQILPCSVASRPLIDPPVASGMDLQLHVFGIRP
jgi:FkbM family methyltransferase